MKNQLLKPDNIQEQLEPIFRFIFEQNQSDAIAHPRALVEGFYNGSVKIFTASDEGKLVGLRIILIIQDPITPMRFHRIDALSLGEVSQAFVENALIVYQ